MAANSTVGYWGCDPASLPCFHYTGPVPFIAHMPDGRRAKLPADPWFLLGNYHFTLFTHVSGRYQFISGKRALARLNQGAERNSGENRAELLIENSGRRIALVGPDSPLADSAESQRIFGCGFAYYQCASGGVQVTRTLSAKPSRTPYDGSSAFLLCVRLQNQSDQALRLVYTESVRSCFTEIQYQEGEINRLGTYTRESSYSADGQTIFSHTHFCAGDPLLAPSAEAMSLCDGFPPVLFLRALQPASRVSCCGCDLTAVTRLTVQPGETACLRFIIGCTGPDFLDEEQRLCRLLNVSSSDGPVSAFAAEWREVLPQFHDEPEKDLAQEMQWHAYVLEAMATYSDFYGETKIPQGTIYEYDWGLHASARDHLQHALACLYYNPTLARSTIRYILQRTTASGEIRMVERGYGYADSACSSSSDQQLYFFLLLAEYLRVTEDYGLLFETVRPYPVTQQAPLSILSMVERCYRFLKDAVSVGEHGLVQLLNADWNDAVYFILPTQYNRVVYSGESHMNTALALYALHTLTQALQRAGEENAGRRNELQPLLRSMLQYRQSLLDAYLRDLGNRPFPLRMYLDGRAYGTDNLFLEAQGYTLALPELPAERKRLLYQELRRRVYAGEAIGAREQQAPEFDDPEFDPGSRENGGFWWALNGPVILGVLTFDPPEARRLLEAISLRQLARHFPRYWTSYWSSADNLESSLIPEEGLPDQSGDYASIPVFCAHPHAWLLYCYERIRECEKHPPSVLLSPCHDAGGERCRGSRSV